jgi:hydrogenase maturation protease
MVIVGIGNDLRGEDGFGIAVARRLSKSGLKTLTTVQLVPEMCLTLQSAQKIVFVDASIGLNYLLATPLPSFESGFTHQINPFVFMALLRKLYGFKGAFYLYSMQTKNFDKIADTNKYQDAIIKTCESILTL